MQNEHTNPFKLKSLYVISKVLAKLHHIKKQGEKEMAVEDLLNTLRFFQRFIADTTQRHQFLNVACDFMKFKFYTKGSAICHIGNPISNLSILIDGKIGLFVPKDPEELESINHDLRRNHVIEYYSDYIQEHKSREKVKSQTEIGVHGPVSPRKGKSYSLTQIKELGMTQPTSNGLAQKVLAQKNTIIPESLLESDISTEEKLLLLAHHDQLEKCIFEGELTMKSVGYLSVGDTFGEETLLKTVPAKYTMVAMEDVYLVSLSREDYTFLYSMPELENTSEKIQFLAKIFPDLSREARMKLAFYLEERVYASREVIYREGVEADAIYMVKNGEVEYVTYEKPQKARSNTSNKLGPLAVPALKVGNLSSGTIFGEEEVVNMTIRKSSATAKQVNTFLYVLRKEVYHEMFAKHVPYIAGLFRDWIQLKKVLKGEVETKPSEWPIREKKSPIHSPRLVIKTTASPRDTSEPIIDRLKDKQNLLKIQSSIGIKAPTKMVPILDTNSIASPHYQEKRLKSLDFHRVNVNTLISLEQLNPQRIVTEQQKPVTDRKQPVITSPALKSPKLSNINLKTLEDIQEQKSNLFILNQKQIDAKRRGSMSPRTKIPVSIKLVPLDKAASPFSRNTDTGLASELKKNLLISMSGAQTSRTNEKDSATFESAMKNGSLNSIASSPIIKKSNPNSILNIGPLDQPIDQIRLNMNKMSTNLGLKLDLGNILTKTEGKLIKGSHRRVKTHLGSPVKLGLPLELEKLMMGPEKNASEGLAKRGI